MVKTTIIKIKKRSGRIVKFNPQKIAGAIEKAFKAIGEKDGARVKFLADKVVEKLEAEYNGKIIPQVEEIQNLVEETLMEHGHYDVARAYILYRDLKNRVRDIHSLVDSDELVGDYLSKLDWRVRENSNMAYSLQGLNNHVASVISANYWLNKIYSPPIREAHVNGDLHIHNLQMLAAYCCGWDLWDLLFRGFGGVVGKIECKPPKHFRTALGQLVNFFYTLQGEIAGAVAVSNFDTLLAPFIAADKLAYPEVKQALQEFIFNMNVPTRVGFQTPFSNVTLDLNVPDHLKKEAVIIGGKPQNQTYGDFQKEVSVFNQAFTEVMLEGDAKGRVFTFPIPTYNITKDFAWDNPIYEGIWEMTRKYGIPYFSNFINSDMKPEDARSMCLAGNEEILIKKQNPGIIHLTMEELANDYGVSFNKEGWGIPKEKIEVLSLNPVSLKTEWAGVKRFLRIKASKLITIRTGDGKEIKISVNHPLVVLSEKGMLVKLARHVKVGDYLLSLKQASGVLNNNYQNIENLTLEENLAKILGFFTADGNFLFETRRDLKTYRQPRGLQFTFNAKTKKHFGEIKNLLESFLGVKTHEKKDLRYNTYYLYVYDTALARKIYKTGFRKYGRLPDILFNSPKPVIEAFLDYFFAGDGYKKRNEIHLNDYDLARDLVFLYSLVGKPTTFKKRKNSQVIYIPEEKNKYKINGLMNNPVIYDRVPAFMVSTYLVPGLTKNRMVGIKTLEKYQAKTDGVSLIESSDIYITRVVKVRTEKRRTNLYDLELTRNHLFIHSLGTVSHNCCRLRLDNRELAKRGGGLFGSYPLTGSLGVVTLNMPRVGYLSKSKKEYFERVSHLMDLAKEALLLKRQVVEKFTEEGLYPYSKVYLGAIKDRFGEYWKNHFNTIGLIGMNESLLNFMGKNIGTEEGRAFAEEVLDFMRTKLLIYQKETDQMFNLEATPAEGTSYNLAKLDKKLYPKIICANEEEVQKAKAEPYYTNSTHLPVNFTDDIFEALNLQDDLQTKYTGGTVLHGFLGESLPSGKAVKSLVKKIAENYHLPYYTITPTFSVCPSHGYLKGEQKKCPKCGKTTEVWSRIVGYLRPVAQWNAGKQAEFAQRKTYNPNF